MVNLKQKDAYIHAVAKILYEAKHPMRYWALEQENGKRIDQNSETKQILNKLGIFTPEEFMKLIKGHETLEISNLQSVNPYEIKEEQNGIYIETCRELDSLVYGRKYCVIEDDKKMCVTLNTKNEKTISACIVERQAEGLYIYSTGTGEIRLITNGQLSALCDKWRILLRESIDVHTDGEIITGLMHSTRINALNRDGVLIANQVFKGEEIDETKINQLFNLGIKGYIEMYSPRVVKPYESELTEVDSWTR